MNKNSLLVILILVSLFGVWVLWMQSRPTDGSVPEQVNKLESEDNGVVLVPNVDQIQSEEAPPTKLDIDREFRQEVKTKIETALDGNIEDLITVVKYMNECDRAPKDESSIVAQARTFSNIPGFQFKIPDENGISQKDVSFDEWEVYQWNLFDQCQSINGLFDEGFRNRIKMQAENGNIIARYMYAIRPPTAINDDPDHIIERLDYELLALEFTWQSINEGEPLGLLALGQSYMGLGLFTPHQRSTGGAFFIAARKCGLSNAWVDLQIDNFTTATFEEAQVKSNAIVETFCN